MCKPNKQNEKSKSEKLRKGCFCLPDISSINLKCKVNYIKIVQCLSYLSNE